MLHLNSDHCGINFLCENFSKQKLWRCFLQRAFVKHQRKRKRKHSHKIALGDKEVSICLVVAFVKPPSLSFFPVCFFEYLHIIQILSNLSLKLDIFLIFIMMYINITMLYYNIFFQEEFAALCSTHFPPFLLVCSLRNLSIKENILQNS